MGNQTPTSALSEVTWAPDGLGGCQINVPSPHPHRRAGEAPEGRAGPSAPPQLWGRKPIGSLVWPLAADGECGEMDAEPEPQTRMLVANCGWCTQREMSRLPQPFGELPGPKQPHCVQRCRGGGASRSPQGRGTRVALTGAPPAPSFANEAVAHICLECCFISPHMSCPELSRSRRGSWPERLWALQCCFHCSHV